jgi:hypothetical protein
MAQHSAEPRRREIFHLLVRAQDLDMSVSKSYELIRDHFGLGESDIRQIEEEGLARNWPPL